jgi:hypothetical protein
MQGQVKVKTYTAVAVALILALLMGACNLPSPVTPRPPAQHTPVHDESLHVTYSVSIWRQGTFSDASPLNIVLFYLAILISQWLGLR